MEEAAKNTATPDFDVYGAMDWKDGVGTLPGSELKFRVNEFGGLEVVTDEADDESVRKAHATTTWSVPTAHEVVKEECGSWSQRGAVCVRCQRKGSAVDFLCEGRYCSEHCQQQDQQDECNAKKEVSKSNGEATGASRKRHLPPEKLPEETEAMMDAPEEEDEDYEEKDIRKAARGAPRGRRKRRGDAALLRHTVPYGGKKKCWCWASYLEQEKATAAPTKLFKEHQSFPQSKNGFRVGMKLEGVDPEHPAMYTVLTVAEVSGHRIRLHFDKFSDCYDFWVNASSPDIHPVGWCEKTGHKLHPPKGMTDEEFTWSSYIKQSKGQAAPKALFENHNTTVTPQGFRVGMKMEAVDRKNPSFICVATVADMVDSRFLVHFDNWDQSYDYWCDATSPYIHPIGWCQDNGKTLTTPPGYPTDKDFCWERYLEETGASPAPARAFKVKPPHCFQVYMKLEAVDKRNPMLIRVATVVDTDDHRIQLHFDGWSDDYDCWVDTDSPDIHPAGWCAKTGHPLQPPISAQEMYETSEQSGCPTPGCKGVGHIKGARYSGHHSAVGCPYSDINMSKGCVLPDRVSGEMPGSTPGVGRPRRVDSTAMETNTADSHPGPVLSAPERLARVERPSTAACSPMDQAPKKPTGTEPKRRVGRPCKPKKVEEPVEEEGMESEVSSVTETKELTLQQALHQSVFMPSGPRCPSSGSSGAPGAPGVAGVPGAPVAPVAHCWDQHSKLLPTVAGITASTVATWTVQEVTDFIQGLPGCREHVRTFREQQIDGEAFLLLTQGDLVKILSIKLGPALKIYNSILMFKTAEDSAHNEL